MQDTQISSLTAKKPLPLISVFRRTELLIYSWAAHTCALLVVTNTSNAGAQSRSTGGSARYCDLKMEGTNAILIINIFFLVLYCKRKDNAVLQNHLAIPI